MGNGESTRVNGHAEGLVEGGFLGAIVHTRSYLNITYLLLSFPLGVFYFVFLIVGLSLGFGLTIIGIGLIILLGMLVAMRGLAAWERLLGIWLLGAHIPPPNPMPAPWQHPLIALKKYVTDSYTWKSLVYLLVKFPLGIISFVIAVFLTSSTVILLLAPLLYRFVDFNFFFWRVRRAEEALLCLAAGLLLGVVSIHVMNGVAVVCRGFATWMLTGVSARQSQLKKGPVVIP